MGKPIDRAGNREKRRSGRNRNHEPLLRLVQEQEIYRPSVKPSTTPIKPLTEAQRIYDISIRANILTFGVGPAGTGKTWWAARRAAEALKNGETQKIYITRPALEAADEKLGFLPGELDEKVEPYMRPVREAFEEALGSGQLEYFLKAGIIEPRPLAYLRGATFKNCWVIGDEMQNTTVTGMKLFLTRIGENSKIIVNGDPRQIDLPRGTKSGLVDVMTRLRTLRSAQFVRFTADDIVRSGIVRDIVSLYENDDEEPSPDLYNEHHEADDTGLRKMLKADDD